MKAGDIKAVALAGNPNCGKTTLFNRLTGANQYVGNWPGVTVQKKQGEFVLDGQSYLLTDLPGIYSLSPFSMEEQAARNYILEDNPSAILNIVDGTNLQRNLYLTLQLMDLERPMAIAVNMMDEAAKRGIHIDCDALSARLGVPVIPISARRGDNLNRLLQTLHHIIKNPSLSCASRPRYDYRAEHAISEMASLLADSAADRNGKLRFLSVKLLEGDADAAGRCRLAAQEQERAEGILTAFEASRPGANRETLFADIRYRLIEEITAGAVSGGTPGISDRIDAVVTNRFLAIPLFFLFLGTMFLAAFGPPGKILNGLLASGLDAVRSFTALYLEAEAAPSWIRSLLLDAVLGGVGSILTFLPQIMILFFFLSVLEDSGYMARAAFIMDKPLQKTGLSGKAFIPMLMGFGCTTPAVMAARVMEQERDRRLTIMITPFMSCSARLPVYALFAGVFFPAHQGAAVLAMYVLGMAVALISGSLFSHTLFCGDAPPFVMELPPYRLPDPRSTLLHMWEKCKGFIIRAGTVIFAMNVVIWLLQYFDPTLHPASSGRESLFGIAGAWLAPLFRPLGFGDWRASVSLLAGLVAKESVVSTMSVLYAGGTGESLAAALSQAFTPLSALSFMTFTLLYMPCISAFASIRREMNSTKWAFGVAAYTTGTAYLCALLVYQIGRLLSMLPPF